MMKGNFFLIVFLVFSNFLFSQVRGDSSLKTKALLHAMRGEGARENTLEGAIYGFEHFDGVEGDVVVSKDGTVWLSHNTHVKDENGKKVGLFSKTRDKDIEAIGKRSPDHGYDKLGDVLDKMGKKYINKYISIDTKRPQWLFVRKKYKKIAKHIVSYLKKYPNLKGRLLIESDNVYYLNKLKNVLGVQTYYMSWGNFSKGKKCAKKHGYTGLSHDFYRHGKKNINEKDVKKLHNRGLKIIHYTVNDPDKIKTVVKDYKSDYVETDNLKFYNYIN